MENTEKRITDDSFTTGKILKMALMEDDGIVLKNSAVQRNKYFTVIGQDKDNGLIGSLLINSDVNKNVINTKVLLDCQFPLQKNDYNFLNYNSYLDCSELFELDKIKILQKGMEVGELTSKDKRLVMEHLRDSEVISAKLKKRYRIINN